MTAQEAAFGYAEVIGSMSASLTLALVALERRDSRHAKAILQQALAEFHASPAISDELKTLLRTS